MPSSSYFPVSNRGLVKGFSKQTVGGEIPSYLQRLSKNLLKGVLCKNQLCQIEWSAPSQNQLQLLKEQLQPA